MSNPQSINSAVGTAHQGRASESTDSPIDLDEERAWRGFGVLEYIEPEVALSIQQRHQRIAVAGLLEEARAIVDLVRIASLSDQQEDMDPHAIYNATYLASRLIEVGIKADRGDW